jgi:transcription elongation factor Elf1
MFLDLLRQEVGDAKGAGGETRFNCPFCNEHKHKLYVSNDKGLWTCFKCGMSGNPVKFVQEYFMMTFTEAVDLLAQYDYDVKAERDNQKVSLSTYGNDLTEEEQLLMFIVNGGDKPVEEVVPKTFTCPTPPTNCKTLIANFDNPEAFPFFMYLHNRGVTLDHIKEHNISYVTYGEVKLADGRSMNLVNHVVFFTFDNNHRPIYWNTRSIESNPFIKSFNAPSRMGEYSKENTVFNINNARKYQNIFIHEGVFNSFMTPQGGIATFGKQITTEQLHIILQETPGKPLFLMQDTDAWEQMIKAANRIHEMEPHRQVYFVYSGLDDDVNDLGFDGTNKLLATAFPADSDGELKLRLLVLNNYRLTL